MMTLTTSQIKSQFREHSLILPERVHSCRRLHRGDRHLPARPHQDQVGAEVFGLLTVIKCIRDSLVTEAI